VRRTVSIMIALVVAMGLVVSAGSAAGASPGARSTLAADVDASKADSQWWAAGTMTGWDESCRQNGVPCFLLTSPAGSDGKLGTTLIGYGEDYLAPYRRVILEGRAAKKGSWYFLSAAGSSEFLIKTVAEGKCLGDSMWGAVRTYGACDISDADNAWHLLRAPEQAGKYMLQNRAGYCLRLGVTSWAHIKRCEPNNDRFWFVPMSRTQAQLWGELALGYAQTACVTDAKAGKPSCSFVPDDPTFDSTPPVAQANECNASDVMAGSPVRDTEYTVSWARGRTTSSTESSENTVTVQAGTKTGVKDVWEANVSASYSRKWGATSNSSNSETVTVGQKVVVPAGKFAWTYATPSVGVVPGTYTYFIGSDYRWSLHSTLPVSAKAAWSSNRTLAFGDLVDYDPRTFSCQMGTALQPLQEPRITGWDEAADTAPRVGQTLRVDPGIWSASGRTESNVTYTYQWMRGDQVLSDTGPTHTVSAGDLGKHLWARVIARFPTNMPGRAQTVKTEAVMGARPTPTPTPVSTPTVTPTPDSTPRPVVEAPSPSSVPATPEPTPLATATGQEQEAESPAATSTSVTALTPGTAVAGKPAFTVVVRSDDAGFAGELQMVVVDLNGAERVVSTIPLFARAGKAIATTTLSVPADIEPGEYTFAIRFTPTDSSRWAASSATQRAEVTRAP